MYRVRFYRRYLYSGIFVQIFLVYFLHCTRITYKVIIPASEIKQSIKEKFPKSKTYADIIKITLSDPSLILGKSKNKLTIGLKTSVSQSLTGIIISRGRLVFSSGLKFDDSTAEFRFHQVTIDTMSIDMGNLNREVQAGIRDLMGSMVRESVENSSFYRMKPGNIKTGIARLFIRKVRIYKEGVEVTLGM